MKPQQNCDSGMDEAAIIRAVYPRDAMKRLARLLSMPLDTARHNLYRRFSAARRCELALALLAELDRQDTERAHIRSQLREMAGGRNAPVDRAGTGVVAHTSGLGARHAEGAPDRAQGRKVRGGQVRGN